MRTTLLVFTAFIMLTFLVSCKSKNAFAYNQKLADIENGFEKDIDDAELKIEKYVDNEQYDSLAIIGEKLEQKLDAGLKEITALKAPDEKEGKILKEAFIKMMQYSKDIYTNVKNIGNAKDTDSRASQSEALNNLVAKRQAILTDVQNAQKAFATANGFRIEKK
jgi:nickel-dependent lactate racemase